MALTDHQHTKGGNDSGPMAARISCDTHRYEASHGKAPGGWGLWMFRIGEECYGATGFFTESRQQALKFARLTGAPTVEVLP